MITKNTLVTRSEERGKTQIDWLDSKHSFSFGGFYDPQRSSFGPLRVLNEDRVAPGGGFSPHPHRDMEIVSIVLDGQLEHKDSLGNGRVIETGDIQYMSAGSGLVHGEFNPSQTKPVHFLQIWIEPEEKGLPPHYEDRKLLPSAPNQWSLVLSKDGRADSIAIRNDIELRSAVLEDAATLTHEGSQSYQKQWLFVIRGSVSVSSTNLDSGDSLAISGESSVEVTHRGSEKAEILLFSLPMEKA
ncbi:MAG: pirin family protein [Verrucomicrobiota bacterium]